MSQSSRVPTEMPEDSDKATLAAIVEAAMPRTRHLRFIDASAFEALSAVFLIVLVLSAVFVDVIPALSVRSFPMATSRSRRTGR